MDFDPFIPFKASHETWYRLGILSEPEILAQYCRLARIDSIDDVPFNAALSVSAMGDVSFR